MKESDIGVLTVGELGLRDYAELEYKRNRRGSGVLDFSHEKLTPHRQNDEEDELLYILTGAKLQEEGILTPDYEYRSLVFYGNEVRVKLIHKGGRGVKEVEVTELFHNVANNLGLEVEYNLDKIS